MDDYHYFLKDSCDLVNIHGSLNDKLNPIIFGYGDEEGEDYRIIENINKNEYFEHAKSFMYLRTSNYKKMIEFIESNKFNAWVIGLSCGLTDRVMLKHIFTHSNCEKINVVYYKNLDNYTSVVQNISRHFGDMKQKFREKVVPYTESKKCPQLSELSLT